MGRPPLVQSTLLPCFEFQILIGEPKALAYWTLRERKREIGELCMCGTHLGHALGSIPKSVVPYIFLSFFPFSFPFRIYLLRAPIALTNSTQ